MFGVKPDRLCRGGKAPTKTAAYGTFVAVRACVDPKGSVDWYCPNQSVRIDKVVRVDGPWKRPGICAIRIWCCTGSRRCRQADADSDEKKRRRKQCSHGCHLGTLNGAGPDGAPKGMDKATSLTAPSAGKIERHAGRHRDPRSPLVIEHIRLSELVHVIAHAEVEAIWNTPICAT